MLTYARYVRDECGFRMALFFSAATLAGAFGGVLARGIAEMSGVGGKAAWAVSVSERTACETHTDYVHIHVVDFHPRRTTQHPRLNNSILVYIRLPRNVSPIPPSPTPTHLTPTQCPFPHSQRTHRSPTPPPRRPRPPLQRFRHEIRLPSPHRLENIHLHANLHGGLLSHLLLRPLPAHHHQEHGLHCQ